MKGVGSLRRKQRSPSPEAKTTLDDDIESSRGGDQLAPLLSSSLGKRVFQRADPASCGRAVNTHGGRSWWVWLVIYVLASLLAIDYIVFYIRYFTMSRPSWLYGSPMAISDVQACLVQESTSEKPTPKFPTPLEYWEWHKFSSMNSTSTSRPRQRLLIAQFTGYGKYSEMLDLVAPVNLAYAQRWGHDMLLLQGTALSIPQIDDTQCNNEPRSTFNKIPILQEAMEHEYDQLLILDTDAMIVDFSADITALLDTLTPPLLMAHRVWRNDWTNTWDVNAGITLWNLHHPTLSSVFQQWHDKVLEHPSLVVERNDDQYFLQWTLLEMGYWNRHVESLVEEFAYYEGTLIQHFKRDARSWTTTSLEQRLLRIREVIQDQVCLDFQPCQYQRQQHGQNGDMAEYHHTFMQRSQERSFTHRS